jgi:hypothetical protein
MARKNNFPETQLFEYEEELNLTEELNNYFNIIKEHLVKRMNYNESQSEFETILNKIYD